MKTKSFGNRLLLQVLSVTTIVFTITMFFVTSYSFSDSQENAEKYIAEIAEKYSKDIQSEVNESITISKIIASKFTNSLKSGYALNEKEMLEFSKSILKDNEFIIGIWFKIKEKELFFKANNKKAGTYTYDKTGQFNPYLAKDNGKITIAPGSAYGENLEWVKGPMESKKTYITKPYLYPVNGVDVLMSTVAIPIYDLNGKFIGTTGVDISLDTFVKMTSKIKVYDNGYTFLVDHFGRILGHPIKDLLNKDLLKVTKNGSDYIELLNKSKQGKDYSFFTVSYKDGIESQYFSKSFKIDSLNENWSFVISVPKNEYLYHANFILYFSIISSIIGLIIIAGIIYYSVKKLNFNLKSISNGLDDFFKYLNKENSSSKQIEIKSNDEFGTMAGSINKNVSTIQKSITEDNNLIEDVKKVVNTVSNGKLDTRITQNTSTESLNELKNLLNDMLNTLENTLGKDLNTISKTLDSYTQRNFTAKLDEKESGKIGKEIIMMNKMITSILQDNQKDGQDLQSSAQELTSNVSVLSENATSQAASLEETAASIDEITSNIESTSQKAQEMRTISTQTQSSSNEGKNLATSTAKAMEEINEQVTAINEAITVIDQIAFQTNILSLNAAVEAATAGEAGKGFAVVAQEVRNLASRSAEAAKEIKELVETATLKADNGKAISSKMIEGFSELEEKISATNDLISDVSSAAQEQSQGMIQISSAINQLDKFTQENAIVAEKAKEIAKETNSIALNVVEQVNKNNFDGKIK